MFSPRHSFKTAEEQIAFLRGEISSLEMTVESYKRDAQIYFEALEIAESSAKEEVQSEMATLRAENGKLKEEIVRLSRLRYAARDFAEKLPDVF